MSKEKESLKDKPSLVIVEDHHHYHKKGQVIEKLPTRGVDKQILVLNTDKHPRVWIVTPDVIIDLMAGKGRKHPHSTDVRIMPNLWDEKERKTLSLGSFDDMREANITVEGERKGDWVRWLKEDDE